MRHGLSKKPRRRRLIGHPGKPTSIISAPNQIWSADFKGHFKLRDGVLLSLNVTDNFSRYCGCRPVHLVLMLNPFSADFFRFGLPHGCVAITAFLAPSLVPLSTLSRRFIRRH